MSLKSVASSVSFGRMGDDQDKTVPSTKETMLPKIQQNLFLKFYCLLHFTHKQKQRCTRG